MILIKSLRAVGRFRGFDPCSRPTGIGPLIFDASEFSYGRSGGKDRNQHHQGK